MPSHRLILEKKPMGCAWLLEWDELTLTLRDPDGELVFEMPAEHAHRLVDMYDLDGVGQVTFDIQPEPLTFKPQREAARDLRELVLRGLRTDAPFRELQKRHARLIIPVGLAAFVVCGGLFALYCWWASWAPDPPDGHWIRYAGPFVNLVLLVLLAFGLGGPYAALLAWRQLRRIRAIEQTVLNG